MNRTEINKLVISRTHRNGSIRLIKLIVRIILEHPLQRTQESIFGKEDIIVA